MRTFAALIGTLVLLLASLPAAPAQAQRSPASWTVLVYLDADNNLEREAIDDFLEMAAIGSSAAINVVVQFDRVPGYDSRYGDWTGTLRFRVTQGMTPQPASAIADLGEVNMGHPQTLSDFVSWGRATYPAQRTALVIWNHGDGWRTLSSLKGRRKAIAWDDTDGRDALNMGELRQALSSATQSGAWPIDVLAFDACLMAMIEVDAEIAPYVRVRAASEENEPNTGYPFDAILADLQNQPEQGAADLGRAIVERYYEAYDGETHSAFDLGSGYGELIAAVDGLALALLQHQDAQADVIQQARQGVQQFQANYVDLYHLAQLIAQGTSVTALAASAQAVVDAVDGATVAERHGAYWPGAHGLSIFFPAQASGWDSNYSGDSQYLSFTAQTHWDEFLQAYLDLVAHCQPDAYEPDDEATAARAIEVGGEPQRRSFCPADDSADWVSFAAGAGQTYRIETSDLEQYADTVLKLYDVHGQTLLAEDDDGGAGWASRIEWTSPAAGTYYVQVSEYYGRAGLNTGYTLSVERPGASCQPDAHEPDDSPAAAVDLAVGGPEQEHNFCVEGDAADWIAFQALAGQVYDLRTVGLDARVDTVLTLYDRDGSTVLLADDDGGGEPRASHLRWASPLSGQYYLRVHEREGRTGPDTGYGVVLSTPPLALHGEVRLQGRTSFEGTLIAAQDMQLGLPPYTATTSISGTFALSASPPCTVTARHAGYLAERWLVDETAASEWTPGVVTLLGGDFNDDRQIDILDIVYLAARFDGTDSLADLNADGQVDILDLVLVALNFGTSR